MEASSITSLEPTKPGLEYPVEAFKYSGCIYKGNIVSNYIPSRCSLKDPFGTYSLIMIRSFP